MRKSRFQCRERGTEILGDPWQSSIWNEMYILTWVTCAVEGWSKKLMISYWLLMSQYWPPSHMSLDRQYLEKPQTMLLPSESEIGTKLYLSVIVVRWLVHLTEILNLKMNRTIYRAPKWGSAWVLRTDHKVASWAGYGAGKNNYVLKWGSVTL